jgi:hypothetical protein
MTLITFADAQLVTRDALRRLLGTRLEPYALDVTVSTRDLPGDDSARPLPYVRVTDDGPASRDSRLVAVAPLRVVVWHTDVGLAKALAGLIEGLLLDEAVANGVRGYTPGTGPVGTEDPDTGLPIAYITIDARLAPRPNE